MNWVEKKATRSRRETWTRIFTQQFLESFHVRGYAHVERSRSRTDHLAVSVNNPITCVLARVSRSFAVGAVVWIYKIKRVQKRAVVSFTGRSGVEGRDKGRGVRRWRVDEDVVKESLCHGWNMRIVEPGWTRSREVWGRENMILYSWLGAYEEDVDSWIWQSTITGLEMEAVGGR